MSAGGCYTLSRASWLQLQLQASMGTLELSSLNVSGTRSIVLYDAVNAYLLVYTYIYVYYLIFLPILNSIDPSILFVCCTFLACFVFFQQQQPAKVTGHSGDLAWMQKIYFLLFLLLLPLNWQKRDPTSQECSPYIRYTYTLVRKSRSETAKLWTQLSNNSYLSILLNNLFVLPFPPHIQLWFFCIPEHTIVYVVVVVFVNCPSYMCSYIKLNTLSLPGINLLPKVQTITRIHPNLRYGINSYILLMIKQLHVQSPYRQLIPFTRCCRVATASRTTIIGFPPPQICTPFLVLGETEKVKITFNERNSRYRSYLEVGQVNFLLCY